MTKVALKFSGPITIEREGGGAFTIPHVVEGTIFEGNILPIEAGMSDIDLGNGYTIPLIANTAFRIVPVNEGG